MKRKPYSLSVFALMLAVIILSGLLMLPGCSSSQPDNTNPSDSTPTAPSDGSTPPESTSATEPSGEATVPSTEATEPEFFVPTEYPDITTYGYTLQPPTLPFPAEDAPEEEWMAFFYGVLSKSNSWYCIGLNSFYETTEDLDIGLVFATGITFSSSDLTDEESALLAPSPNSYHRIPKAELDSILKLYFNTSLEACTNRDNWTAQYLEQTDCYYTSNNGAPNYAGVYGIIGYSKLDNGDYAVQYMSDIAASPYGPAEVILHRVGDYFQIISNQAK